MNPAINKATNGLGGSFKGVTLYLVTPKEPELGAPTPERTGFIVTQNLPTDDAGQAWRIMARTAQDREALKAAAGVSTAGRKPKTVKPVFHYALSWHPDQKPTAEQMQEAARSSLRALKLDQHQALIVQHVDEDRAHLHIVVNRVHPETGKLDPLSNNLNRLDRWAHDYEQTSGEIVSPDRAAKFDAIDNGKPPPRREKKPLPRKEWEAQQPPKGERKPAPDRAAAHGDRLARYKVAAADVREQFRPEWAQLYREQRTQSRQLDRDQKATLRELAKCRTRQQRTDFFNRHRELVWSGIDPNKRPGNAHTLLMPARLKAAVEQAQARQLDRQQAAHAIAKKALQQRHDEARQDAQRSAWRNPVDRSPAPADRAAEQHGKPRNFGKLALGVGILAATAIAARRAPTPGHDPQRDLDEAAARIARQRQKTPANEEPRKTKPAPDDLAEARARADSAAERIKQARQRNARARDRDRKRDWLD